MKFNERFLAVACCVLAVLFASTDTSALRAQEGGTLYGIDGFRQLVEIDLENQQITEIGEVGFLVDGITYHPPSGELFGIGIVDNDEKLVRISQNTGLGTVVGSIGIDDASDISYDPSSETFYATSREFVGGPASLIQIDVETGVGEIIGETGFLRFGGLAYDSQDNLLFGTATPIGAASDRELVVLDPVTGVATSLGTVGVLTVGAPRGLTYDPFSDQLLLSVSGFADPMGFSNENQEIYGIDKATGAVISATGFTINDRIGALAFVPNSIPEPTSSSFLMLGFVATLLRRRRQPAGN